MSLLLALELLLSLLALPRLSSTSNSTHPSLDRQAEALLQWKSSLSSWSFDFLDSWTNRSSPCNWSGVACSNAMPPGSGRGHPALVVWEIWLPDCGLVGRLDRLHFADLPHLVYLNLGHNSLSGPIPSSIGAVADLTHLDLSNNGLNGSIPTSLGNCTKLRTLALASNQITGLLPPEIGYCRSLLSLLASDNLLTGQIPQELGYLSNLNELDLSRNSLSGTIPVILYKLNYLFRVNLSYNSLGGKVPSFTGSWIDLDHNKDLCDDSYGLTPCDTPNIDMEHKSRKHSRMVLLAFFAPFSFACLSIASITVVCWRKKCVKSKSKRKSGDVLSIWNFDGKIAFEDILTATENFDEKYCIGVGGYGTVFRVELESGAVFAVKLLHSMEEFSAEETFHAEIEVLTKIRHRCIVKLYGFCSHSQCKFLVYDLIERGSLSSILHEQELAKELNWTNRITIVTDIAQALAYLHHDCDDPIVHRDIKSSNILLNLDYKAYVSDFGMARKLKHGCSSWSTIFAGTCGYIAPASVWLRWKL
ncbi:hypothetical protein CFC21_005276 [Triticum aestivum]|uniref:non-specific serine/threonine protein kinase n=2 Tax=Triticum aestivum TaxID=4565 RepID=A0A9R1D9A0_WHEAT|nr:hypothetical protein CFC21_005276 [Triticum aestivum]